MIIEEKLELLDFVQKKASLLIQGMSFFMTLQREAEMREKVLQEYKTLMELILSLKNGVTDEEIEKEETPVGSTDTGLGEPDSIETHGC